MYKAETCRMRSDTRAKLRFTEMSHLRGIARVNGQEWSFEWNEGFLEVFDLETDEFKSVKFESEPLKDRRQTPVEEK